MTDAELARGFHELTLGDLPHRDHVRLGWLYVTRAPLARAALSFIEDLQRFAASKGAAGKYHETITWAYLLWIHACVTRAPAHADSEAFLAAHPELLLPAALHRFYRPETLASSEARGTFLLPDRPE